MVKNFNTGSMPSTASGKGFSIMPILLVGALLVGGYLYYQQRKKKEENNKNNQ